MSRKITSKPGAAELIPELKKEFRVLYRLFKLKLTHLFRKYPEQCFALMVFLILVSAALNFFVL
ncbi:hypothetical protein HDC92_004351 [Pedobacter sp. AK017]|uniref:hypothetical protein n=1 Tax=Pedobacter sp. AK017 TaxID=2723073 RepID=UPI00161760E6|nr:hypothetical protein [Pedobacter sp. AK017]MBB5440648.1 hypothetical protein [Pedobacter sp. AK017]